MMSKAEFARLCQVKHPMFSPQKWGPLLSMRGNKVDAVESLKTLAGHLDETKRRAAIKRLEDLAETAEITPTETRAEPPMFSEPDAGDAPPAGDGADNVIEHPSWRVRKDRADALNREIELAERMGQLVDATEVRLAIGDAVATFWSELDRARRHDANSIAGELQLNADQAHMLRRALADRDRRFRNGFAETMRKKAGDAMPPMAGRVDQ